MNALKIKSLWIYFNIEYSSLSNFQKDELIFQYFSSQTKSNH